MISGLAEVTHIDRECLRVTSLSVLISPLESRITRPTTIAVHTIARAESLVEVVDEVADDGSHRLILPREPSFLARQQTFLRSA
jgi:hypothetical protein